VQLQRNRASLYTQVTYNLCNAIQTRIDLTQFSNDTNHPAASLRHLELLVNVCIEDNESLAKLTPVGLSPQVSTCNCGSLITSKVPVSYESDCNVLAWTNSPSKYVPLVPLMLSTCTVNVTTSQKVHHSSTSPNIHYFDRASTY